jgi:hypothetical protein
MVRTLRKLETAAIALALIAAQSASAASAYYSLLGGGAQFQIGPGQPLPLQAPTTGGTAMAQVGTGTMFPPLLIPVNADPAKALVQQTTGPDPKKMTIAPGALRRPAAGPSFLGLAARARERQLLQVRTNIEFSAPAPAVGNQELAAGGRTGAPTTTSIPPSPGAYLIRYSKTAAQFGGPLRTSVAPATPIRAWRGLSLKIPCKHPVFGGLDVDCRAQLLAIDPGTLAVFGAPFASTTMTPGGPPPMSPNVVFASVKATGLVAMSASAVATGTATNMATSTGFPWTTGMVTVSNPGALGTPEVFKITGMDSRVAGVGQISLVSGALSRRSLSETQVSRGWLHFVVPEPGAMLGASAALAMVGLCHGIARRRRA